MAKKTVKKAEAGRAIKKSRFLLVKKEFNEDDIEQCYALAKIGMSLPQIAAYFMLGVMTFRRRLEANESLRIALSKGRADAVELLTSAIWQAAEDKNPTMLIYLSKCRLGWSERGPRREELDRVLNDEA